MCIKVMVSNIFWILKELCVLFSKHLLVLFACKVPSQWLGTNSIKNVHMPHETQLLPFFPLSLICRTTTKELFVLRSSVGFFKCKQSAAIKMLLLQLSSIYLYTPPKQ